MTGLRLDPLVNNGMFIVITFYGEVVIVGISGGHASLRNEPTLGIQMRVSGCEPLFVATMYIGRFVL